MKRNLALLVIASSVSYSVFLTGCNTTAKTANSNNSPTSNVSHKVTNDTPPEPYVNALTQIPAGNFTEAKQYCDLTLSDFKSSPFLYNANFIGSLIEDSQLMANDVILTDLSTGSSKASVLLTTSDVDKLKGYGNEVDAEHSKDLPELIKYVTYVLQNYSDKHKGDKYDLQYTPLNEPVSSESMKFFKDVGSPVPSQQEVDDYLSYVQSSAFGSFVTDITNPDGVDYPRYFYYMGVRVANDDLKHTHTDLAKSLLNKVIDITNDDKYNDFRLKAQDALKQIK